MMKLFDLEGLTAEEAIGKLDFKVDRSIYYSKYSEDFIHFLLCLEKRLFAISFIKKLITKIEYKIKKEEILSNFYNLDLGSKLEAIRDINSLVFHNERFIHTLKTKSPDDVCLIKACYDVVFIKAYYNEIISNVVILDFHKTKGIISILENIRVLSCEDLGEDSKITAKYNIDRLKFKDSFLYKVVDDALCLYIEKVIEHFEDEYKECGESKYAENSRDSI